MKEEVLRLDHVSRQVDGRQCLDDFTLQMYQGEILGLLGIDSLGQGELLEILTQNLPLDYGRIYFLEVLVNSYAYSDGSYNKIGIVERHSRLVEDLTIADNIFVLRRGFRKYFIRRKTLNRQLQLYTNELGIELVGDERVAKLSPYRRYLSELVRCMITGMKLVVIKDLSNQISRIELIHFHQLLRHFAGQGTSFLYMANHHEECFKICDRIALMEKGRIVKIFDQRQFERRYFVPFYAPAYSVFETKPCQVKASEEVLAFDQVYQQELKNISFSVQQGECIVIMDMNNTLSGEMIDLLLGERKPYSGQIRYLKKNYRTDYFHTAIKQGIGFINQYPLTSMLYSELTPMENLCFLLNQRFCYWLPKRYKKSIFQEFTQLMGESLGKSSLQDLSVLERYDLIYYRHYLAKPKLLICIQPFADADMYVRSRIVKHIEELKSRGVAVVILAVNLSDSLIPADRLLIFKSGALMQEFSRSEFLYFNRESTVL